MGKKERKGRRGDRTPRKGKISVTREGRRERKDEERELAMEKCPSQEGRREGKESSDVIPVARENMGERSDERKRKVERAGERKTFLLPPLLMTESISVMRRREERGEGRARERWRRNFPPPSPYTRVCPHAGEEEGRWGRDGSRARGRRERTWERGREGVTGERRR